MSCEKCLTSGVEGLYFIGAQAFSCGCKELYDTDKFRYSLLKSSLFPMKYEKYSIKDYISSRELDKEKMVEVVSQIIKNPSEVMSNLSFIYMVGKKNTQKTSVACYIMKKLIFRGFGCKYYTLKKIYDTISNFSGDKGDIIKDLEEEVDFLFIDDAFDLNKLYLTGKSNYQASVIFDFFQQRYNNNKTTFLISNTPLSNVDDKFGEDLKDLIDKSVENIAFLDEVPMELKRSKILSQLGSRT